MGTPKGKDRWSSNPARTALIEVHAKRIVRVQGPRNADLDLREIRIDAPVSRFVRISQRRTHHATAEPHMVEFAAYGLETCLDIA
jgi:hypothetical protein